MNYKTRITTAIATGAVLLNALAPLASASTTLEISGNGTESTNQVKVQNDSNNTVFQNNTAAVNNSVSTKTSTGGNDANANTGGEVAILTGDAKSTVDLSTVANKNVAHVDGCGTCDNGDVSIKVAGNGADSENRAKVENSSTTFVTQNNNAFVNNAVKTKLETGDNDANKNTGGDVLILTGNAMSDVKVANKLNSNVAHVGSENGANGGAEIEILGNGAGSENSVKLTNEPSTVVTQNNYAEVVNEVKSKLNTGDNDANKNTGGDVAIYTGAAVSDVGIDNLVNFNSADIDCGCVLGDVKAKIAENGYDSYNKIKAEFGGTTWNEAGNVALLNNNAHAKLYTGDNDVNKNTGEGTDPIVITGNSVSDVEVSNELNKNVFGEADLELGGTHLSINFDINDLLNALGLQITL